MLTEVELPKKAEVFFQPSRYKVAYGGRGGGKSHSVAKILLVMGMAEKKRILCTREFQNSMAESVHKLLSDQVSNLGLTDFYEVQNTVIRGRNGTEFLFAGLKRNIHSLKSFEGCTDVWVEEAHVVSKGSWDVLIPTIRVEGSTIWVTLNPDLDSDETYQRFIANPPDDAIVIKMNWQDNPWFPEVLRKEKDSLKKRDPIAYENVWEGKCKPAVEGAIYAKELSEATEQKRITSVPYDRTSPVNTAWDLGWADNTCIWFWQRVGLETRIIDHISGSGLKLADYLLMLQDKRQELKYVYGTDYLPHDARQHQMASGTSIQEMMKRALRTVKVIDSLSVADGINAVRTLFPNLWFDKERCVDGIQSLRHYRWKTDDNGNNRGKEPEHNEHSHDADGLRILALAAQNVKRAVPAIKQTFNKRVWKPGA